MALLSPLFEAGLVLLMVALLVFLAAGELGSRASQLRRTRGVPRGEVVYSDLDRPGETLYSRRLGLAGRPDYVVRQGEGWVPVEVKSGRARVPREGHLLQLAAYGLLVEETRGVGVVPHGYLVYAGGVQHRVEFTPDLRGEVLRVAESIRRLRVSGEIPMRNHEGPERCRACSYLKVCPQRLQ